MDRGRRTWGLATRGRGTWDVKTWGRGDSGMWDAGMWNAGKWDVGTRGLGDVGRADVGRVDVRRGDSETRGCGTRGRGTWGPRNTVSLNSYLRLFALSKNFFLVYTQAPQAQNTWSMQPFVYIENCMGKSLMVKKNVFRSRSHLKYSFPTSNVSQTCLLCRF